MLEYQEFFDSKNDKSIHTLRSYKQHIDPFLLTLKIKSVKDLNSISAGAIRQYRNSLKTSNASKNTFTRVLSSFFGFMYINEYIEFNVFDKIDYLSKTEEEKTIKMPTQDELNIIISSCENKTTKLILNMISRLGIRREEMTLIRLSDISDDGKLSIHGKGNKLRKIKLPTDILEMIKNHIKNKNVDSEYLFSYDGHKVTGSAIYMRVRSHIETLGFDAKRVLAVRSPHKFRHRALTTAYNTTRDAYMVKNLAGHSNLSIGERYIHAEENIYDSVTESL